MIVPDGRGAGQATRAFPPAPSSNSSELSTARGHGGVYPRARRIYVLYDPKRPLDGVGEGGGGGVASEGGCRVIPSERDAPSRHLPPASSLLPPSRSRSHRTHANTSAVRGIELA